MQEQVHCVADLLVIEVVMHEGLCFLLLIDEAAKPVLSDLAFREVPFLSSITLHQEGEHVLIRIRSQPSPQ